ncbi:hypothetical protein MMAR_1464 [Mycobacterium marinum M]|uniref:Uncharacterized protein n=1 Tax=Mycobacterium marinum (strain ATCC BAA-535 / M) TaxID=216594 RepID=B2HGD0_MYCMM|nr:hypothetical protein MMAR_1464 [Mycobacterium marinum M]
MRLFAPNRRRTPRYAPVAGRAGTAQCGFAGRVLAIAIARDWRGRTAPDLARPWRDQENGLGLTRRSESGFDQGIDQILTRRNAHRTPADLLVGLNITPMMARKPKVSGSSQHARMNRSGIVVEGPRTAFFSSSLYPDRA